jgi:hypothetical protein
MEGTGGPRSEDSARFARSLPANFQRRDSHSSPWLFVALHSSSVLESWRTCRLRGHRPGLATIAIAPQARTDGYEGDDMTVTLRTLFLALAMLLTTAAIERPPPGAVIDEVARYTGLTNDAVTLALKDNAAALGRLTDAVLAVQIAQRFLDAREAEIAADVLASATDTAAEALLPPPLMTAIKAVRLYKSMLEAARDKIVIPALDRQLYAVYRAEREQNQDITNAFSFATSQSLGGGYYVVQPKMVEEYIASYKDWNPDLIGEPMRRRAERQVDRFWMARFEATYQQEKARPQQEAILAAIWGSVRDIIDQLKAPAGALNAGLFIDPAGTLPSGWWLFRTKSNVYPPKESYDHEFGTGWSQSFMISNGVGFVYGKDDYWCTPKPRNCAPPWLQVGLNVRVDKPATEAAARTTFEQQMTGSAMPLTRLSRDAAWSQDNEYVHIFFIVGPYSANVSVRQNPRAGLVTLAIAQNYAHVLAEKLRAQAPGVKTELPF